MARVGFLGDDIDNVFARDLDVEKPNDGVEELDRFEPSEV